MNPAQFGIVLVALFGAVFGSFLNVVIYRLPRGLSVTNPRWSFCPHCRTPIRFYDNIPILGWLSLRGRCRACQTPISAIYPVIECLTLLLFITVWDALFTAQMVPGVTTLGTGWPMAVTYLALFAGLLAGAAMDIESYLIDIRICVLVMVIGVVGHALSWGLSAPTSKTPVFEATTILPPALCLVGLAMGLAWGLTSLIAGWLRPGRDGQDDEELVDDAGAGEASSQAYGAAKPGHRFRPLPIIVLGALIAGLLIWQAAAADASVFGRIPPGGQRGFAACFIFMLVLVLASMVPRQADEQIVEEIEAERAGARGMAVRELSWFIPAIIAAVVAIVLLRRSGHMGDEWRTVLHGLCGDQRWASIVAGGLQTLAAGCLAAGVGWAVRILGTLAFGKEAFGTGDIYIMAAIGAAAGLPLLFFAFFLAALLALVGVLATFFHKSSRAIPFGPWLALGTLVALWMQPVLIEFFRPAAAMLWAIAAGRSGAWSIGG